MSDDAPQDPVRGSVAEGFEPVRRAYAELLATDPDAAAQFVAHHRGEVVVDLWGGEDVGPDDLQGVYSCTKGMSAICLGRLLGAGQLSLDRPVADYWPQFAAGGKGEITVRQALSHQAGLPGLEPQLNAEQLLDHDAVAARLAAKVPDWRPGSAHGYHAATIGTIMDELCRRITGQPIGDFHLEQIAGPRAIDAYITTPERAEARVRDLLAPRPGGEELPPRPDSLSGMAFNDAAAVPGAPLEPNPNRLATRQRGQAAISGVASARGLARLYASTIGEVDGQPPLLSAETVTAMSQIQVVGQDVILASANRFAIVFQKPDARIRYGSHLAFGHDGAGGAIGVADPWYELAFAWIPRRMTNPGGADERGLDLGEVVRACLGPQPVPAGA